MRDPNRIDAFCEELNRLWHKVPDWRFGQLISNVLGAYVDETKRDIFFPEDDEMLAFFQKYFAPKETSSTIRIYGGSDDLVEIEGAGSWDNEYDCYDRDVIVHFDEGTVLRMTYEEGRWKAVVENKGTAHYTITKMIDGDDYYSDLFEIKDTYVLNVKMEDV